MLTVDNRGKLTMPLSIESRIVFTEPINVLGKKLVELKPFTNLGRIDLPQHEAVNWIVLHDRVKETADLVDVPRELPLNRRK